LKYRPKDGLKILYEPQYLNKKNEPGVTGYFISGKEKQSFSRSQR
jgi:hypothetical protein